MRKVCAVCGSDRSAPFYRGLLKCKDCAFVWADLSLSMDEMRKMYDHTYFFEGEYRDYLAEEKILKRNFGKILRRIKRYVPDIGSGERLKLLEVGSAYGFFLDVAQEQFSVTGVELNEEAASFASMRGHAVKQGDLLAVDFPEAAFDVIVCLATLEHLQHPNRYVEKIASLLKPGGLFYCTTCDIGSWFARLCGPRWRVIHPPSHLSYYSVMTLKRLLDRFGLETIHWERMWQYRSFDVVLYPLLVGRLKMSALYQLCERIGITRLVFGFSLCDDVYLAARKRA